MGSELWSETGGRQVPEAVEQRDTKRDRESEMCMFCFPGQWTVFEFEFESEKEKESESERELENHCSDPNSPRVLFMKLTERMSVCLCACACMRVRM